MVVQGKCILQEMELQFYEAFQCAEKKTSEIKKSYKFRRHYTDEERNPPCCEVLCTNLDDKIVNKWHYQLSCTSSKVSPSTCESGLIKHDLLQVVKTWSSSRTEWTQMWPKKSQ